MSVYFSLSNVLINMHDFFEKLLLAAINNKYQDIYLLPSQNGYEIKMHDGIYLIKKQILSNQLAQKLISYIKYFSGMNIAENRRPQLGAIEVAINNLNYPLRISTVSDFQNKETVVIRIIYGNKQQVNNWLDEKQLEEIQDAIPDNGLVLLVGPTGSGKTSTIHQLLNKRSQDELILSIEDPVEIRSPNIVQLQVNEQADMNYEDLIKVSLRHHPDILFIGEIRDTKTAKATIQASLSGHLVFATIHANSAKDAIKRLVDLNVDENLVLNTLRLSIYQRLIPLRDGKLASLVDIQDKHDLHNDRFSFKDDWKLILNDSKQQNIISKNVFEKFQKVA